MVRKTGKRLSSRAVTWLWIIGVSLIVFALLYWEQVALLYVLATLGVSGLLVVVGLSDLSHARKNAAILSEIDDSAALGSGISAANSGSGAVWETTKSKRRP
jgi:hypothetical protein